LWHKPVKPGNEFKIIQGFNPYVPFPTQWEKYLTDYVDFYGLKEKDGVK
jgi:hypothetical protein